MSTSFGYPVQLDVSERICLVIGGGHVATRKVIGLLEAAAKVIVLSPQMTEDLHQLVAEKRIAWQRTTYEVGSLVQLQADVGRIWLMFAATDRVELNRKIVDEARALNILTSSASDPQVADFTLPAIVRRGALTLTVSTSGASPLLTQQIRDQLAQTYGDEYGPWLAFLSEFREFVMSTETDERMRRKRFAQVLTYDGPAAIRAGRWHALQELIWRECTSSVEGSGE